MIVFKRWKRPVDKSRVAPGDSLYVYWGIFLFGVFPLYIHRAGTTMIPDTK